MNKYKFVFFEIAKHILLFLCWSLAEHDAAMMGLPIAIHCYYNDKRKLAKKYCLFIYIALMEFGLAVLGPGQQYYQIIRSSGQGWVH